MHIIKCDQCRDGYLIVKPGGQKHPYMLGWIRHTHLFRGDEYECSSCQFFADKPYNVCPFCGLQMRSVKHDPSWVDEMEAIDVMFDD